MGRKSRKIKINENNNKQYYSNSQISRIKELEAEIQMIKDEMHNNGMNGAAKPIQEKLLENMTSAELKFQHIAKLKGLNLKPQYKINIFNKDKSRIEKFYFADFCDIKNKLIFEIDGDYNFTEEQQNKDLKRTKDLVKAGYKVFRLTNDDVFYGKTSSFLYKAYLSIGINILKK
jgi:very-short-patch-repair endonuclease